jgi:hypothetical protein
MNVQEVFRKIAAKLAADFALTAEVQHDGSKGTLREDALRNFLKDRLPGICAIGSGEIVGPKNDTASQQCDLIIYDRLRGIPLLYGESSQVYPIECVFGTIEVKSSLSKEKLLDGLEKIRSVKSLVPDETILHSPMPGFASATARPRPFGIVFAYRLAENSLKSLAENVAEWEANVPEHLWPNLVVVLGEGVIIHTAEKGQLVLTNENFAGGRAIWLGYGEDSLFHAYAAILDMASNTRLGAPNIRRYYDLPKLLGRYSVKNHDRWVSTSTNKKMRLKESFVERIVTWCRERPKISRVEIMARQFGELPVGSEPSDYPGDAYFYDPEHLPGTHQIENPWATQADQVTPLVRTQCPNWWIIVDGEHYTFAQAYMTADDLEEF